MKQILAFVGILAVIGVSFVVWGGRLGALVKVSEIIVNFGASFGGLIISSSSSTLKLMLSQIKQSVGKSIYTKEYYNELLSLMFELINVVKMQNLKALDTHVENPEASSIFTKYPAIMKDTITLNFIIDSFRQVISSKITAHELEAALEEEIEVLMEEYEKPGNKLHATAEAMPGIGILAAVMGIILTMQNLDADVTIIGQSIAGALVGTFTGIFGCYCMFGPLSASMHDIAEEQVAPLHCIRSIITGYLQNLSPHMCVNAGRKHIESHIKPSFTELEQALEGLR